MLSFEVDELEWCYEFVHGWEKAPEGLRHNDVPAVCTDSEDNVFLLCRDTSQVVVYDRDGEFQDAWGAGELSDLVHGIFITPDDEVLIVDGGSAVVGRFTRSGELLQTIGTRGVVSDSGYDGSDYRTVVRGAPPFNRPTGAGTNHEGQLFVSDGYGNSRVHRFSASGTLERSWGEPGAEPGEFHLPHGILVRDDTVLVADRENDRVQLFDMDGVFLNEWDGFHRPQSCVEGPDGLVYVAESAGAARSGSAVPAGRVSVCDAGGNVLCRWSAGDAAGDADFMLSPHGIAVDSEGSVYVGVNAATAGAFFGVGNVSPFLKFARV